MFAGAKKKKAPYISVHTGPTYSEASSPLTDPVFLDSAAVTPTSCLLYATRSIWSNEVGLKK